MKRLIVVLALWMGVGVLAVPPERPPEAPLPDTSDVRQLFADGKYRDVIRTVSKIAASKEWAAGRSNVYELLVLKAEAHLRMTEGVPAAAALESAAKAAPDASSAGTARATAYLIKHSTGLRYVPKATINQKSENGKEHPTIDIVDADTRKAALTALWQDQKAVLEPQITPGLNESASLQNILDTAALVGRLRDFELAANASDAETKKSATTLAEHARAELKEALGKITVNAEDICDRALEAESFQMQISGKGIYDRWRYHGLKGDEPNVIKDALARTDKIGQAAKALSDGLGVEKDFFDPITQETQRVHDRIVQTLKTNYAAVYASREAMR